jgi:hypothetical protein
MSTTTRAIPTRFKFFEGQIMSELEAQMDAWSAAERDGLYVEVTGVEFSVANSRMIAVESRGDSPRDPPSTELQSRLFVCVSYELRPLETTR